MLSPSAWVFNCSADAGNRELTYPANAPEAAWLGNSTTIEEGGKIITRGQYAQKKLVPMKNMRTRVISG